MFAPFFKHIAEADAVSIANTYIVLHSPTDEPLHFKIGRAHV